MRYLSASFAVLWVIGSSVLAAETPHQQQPATLPEIAPVSAPPAGTQSRFVHPGALNTERDLIFLKTQITARKAPWSNAFDKVQPDVIAAPQTIVFVNSRDQRDAAVSKHLAISAYSNALAWRLTGKSAYSRKAVALLNAWAGFKGFTSGTDQDKLHAGWIGALLGQAAELMRTSPDWKPADVTAMQAMFRRSFYPQLNTASRWNGNVDLTQIDAMMTLAVFNDDEAELSLGIDRLEARSAAYFYLKSDGAVPPVDGGDIDAFWFHPAIWIDGLTQETCRDNGHHAQFALASALHGAEVAWNQGVDVYQHQTKRYTAAMELLALQLLTGNMQGTCKNTIATTEVYDTFEIGYNHYHNRMGLNLPNTKRLLSQIVRPKGISDWNIFYETLTHADLPSPKDTNPSRGRSLGE